MTCSTRNLVLALAAMFGVVCGAEATTWYRNVNMGSSNSGGWLTSRTGWRDGNDTDGSGNFTADDDLIFIGSFVGANNYPMRLRVPGKTYALNSLQIGEAGSANEVVHDGGAFKVGDGGLKLVNGNWFCNAGSDMSITCPVSIESPIASPFQIHYGQDQYSNKTVTISGAFTGAADTKVAFGYLPSNSSRVAAPGVTYALGNIDGFAGQMSVQGMPKYPTNGKNFSSRLQIPAGAESTCSIEVNAGGVLKVGGDSGAATIKSVSFAADTRFEVSGAGTGISSTSLKVTDSYTQPGLVEVSIADFALRPPRGARALLLEVPEGMTLDIEKFRLLLTGAGALSAVTLQVEGDKLYAASDGTVGGSVWVLSQDVTQAQNALADMQYWTDSNGTQGTAGAAVPTDGDFFVYGPGGVAGSTGVYKRRLRSNPITFEGNSLHLGDANTFGEVVHDGADGSTITLENQGLFLNNGWWWFNGGPNVTMTLAGDVTVLANTTGYLPSILFAQDQHSNSTGRVTGKLKGLADATLRVGYHDGVGGKTRNNWYEFYDCSEFHGRLYVTRNTSTTLTGREFGSCVRFKSGDVSDCTVELTAKCFASTVDTTGTATIGTLKIAKDAGLMLRGGADGIGHIKVQTALVPPAEGKIAVVWPKFTVFGQSHVPLLTWPATTALTADDFALDQESGCGNVATLTVEEDQTAGTLTLYANMASLVQQTAYYRDGVGGTNWRDNINPTSLTNAEHWSDHALPHPGSDYFTSYNLCMPYAASVNDPNWDYEFPGDSLTLDGGTIWIYQSVLTVPRLVCKSSYICLTMQTKPMTTRVAVPGGIDVSNTLTLRAHQGHCLVLDGAISGSGDINIAGHSGTGNPSGAFELRGDNGGFTGTIALKQVELRPEYHNFDRLFLTLYANSGESLGGALEAFNPRALAITELARLSVTNTDEGVTLADGLNRGVYLYAGGRFHTAADATLDVEWPVLLNGRMWKEGEGTLILGKPLSYEVQAGGAISETPLAGSNVFTVAAGTVKVRHSEAMRMLETSFAANTALVVQHYDGEDDGMVDYGIKALADTPFTLDAGLNGCLPISIDVGEMPMPTDPNFCLPLVTVKNANAESVRGMLRNLRRTWRDMPQRIVTRANPDGETTTFLIQYRHTGTAIILR